MLTWFRRLGRALQATTPDDRGIERWVYRGANRTGGEEESLEDASRRVEAALVSSIRGAVQRRVIPVSLACALVFGIALALGGLGFVYLFPVVILVPIALLRRSVHRLVLEWTPRAASTLLGAGHCACCGYALRGTPVDDDGCRVCPECGAAWDDGRIGGPGPAALFSSDREARRGLLRWLESRAVLVDDNGRLVDAVHPRLWRLGGPLQAELSVEERRRLTRAIGQVARGRRWRNAIGGAVLAIGLVILLGVQVWVRRSLGDVVMTATMLFAVGWLAREATRYAIGTRGIDVDHLRAVMLTNGRCPSCAARLTDETCPNCHARWERQLP